MNTIVGYFVVLVLAITQQPTAILLSLFLSAVSILGLEFATHRGFFPVTRSVALSCLVSFLFGQLMLALLTFLLFFALLLIYPLGAFFLPSAFVVAVEPTAVTILVLTSVAYHAGLKPLARKVLRKN